MVGFVKPAILEGLSNMVLRTVVYLATGGLTGDKFSVTAVLGQLAYDIRAKNYSEHDYSVCDYAFKAWFESIPHAEFTRGTQGIILE